MAPLGIFGKLACVVAWAGKGVVVVGKFTERISKATDEARELNPWYVDELKVELKRQQALGDDHVVYGKMDGIISAKYIDVAHGVGIPFFILLECKLKSFKAPAGSDILSDQLVGALMQCICYCQQLNKKFREYPQVFLLGSKTDCVTVPASVFEDYILNEDWGKAASKVSKMPEYQTKRQELQTNEKVKEACLPIGDYTAGYTLAEAVKSLLQLAETSKLRFQLTEDSIARRFEFFSKCVLNPFSSGGLTGNIREQKNWFMKLVLHPEECYYGYNSSFGDYVVFGDYGRRRVNKAHYISFVKTYAFGEYTAEQCKLFTEICDRLIEDIDRRSHGDFYTPALWVREAHSMLDRELGEDWREKYIVWDCCCGTKNLTRNYDFDELYLSTLYKDDLEIAKKYNPEAVAFQYDFLNDNPTAKEDLVYEDVTVFAELYERAVREGYKPTLDDFGKAWLGHTVEGRRLLTSLIEGKKPLLFLINPPYGAATNLKEKSGTGKSKNGMAQTTMNQLMTKGKLGHCSRNLYAQFLYRIYMIQKIFNIPVSIGLYSRGSIFTGPTYAKLRECMLSYFKVSDGMMFNASEFNGCSDAWAVYFSLWTPRAESDKPVNKWSFTLREAAASGASVVTQAIGEKKVYSVPEKVSCSTWIKTISKVKAEDNVQMTSGVRYLKDGQNARACGRLIPGALGYYRNVANSVQENNTNVFLLSSCAKSAEGISVMPDNFWRVVGNFAARKLITGPYANWVNSWDEYMIPNVKHPKYSQWEKDSLIYALFSTFSQQSSLRDIKYNGKEWDVYNQWFYLTREEVLARVANQSDITGNNRSIQESVNAREKEEFGGGGERFVAAWLRDHADELSPDARAVLDKAKELTLAMYAPIPRDNFNYSHSEYQINNWDAGWYQVKAVLQACAQKCSDDPVWKEWKEYAQKGLEDFRKLYTALADRMRPLVVELGYLYDYPGYVPYKAAQPYFE